MVNDWGRCTGPADAYSQYDGNYGPLVRGNELTNNTLNGMVVRAGTLTTEGIWDDTDIVHIVLGDIDVPNLDTYGGLRLQSSLTESLVVKLSGATAGFTASGRPLEITDRVGGTLQVLGTPGNPVVLTSLADDTIGAGLDPDGNPMLDTDNSPTSTGTAGDWQGITLDEYSNDRNVAVINETEPATGLSVDLNGTTATAQPLGELAQDPEAGDDVLRLGFEVHGTIAYDRPTDVDVYSFQGYAGTEVWMAIDRTSFSLDTVLELVDANGNGAGQQRQLARRLDPQRDCPALGRRLGLRGRVQHQPQRRRHARGAARLGERSADLLRPRQQCRPGVLRRPADLAASTNCRSGSSRSTSIPARPSSTPTSATPPTASTCPACRTTRC